MASNRHAARRADATTTMAIIAALTEIRHCFPWSWSERCNNGRTTKADSSNRRFGANQNGWEEGEREKNPWRGRELDGEKLRERLTYWLSRVERERESVQSPLIYLFSISCSIYPSIYPSLFFSLSLYTFLPLPLPSSESTFLPSVRREKRLPILRRGQDRDFNQLARGFSDPGND